MQIDNNTALEVTEVIEPITETVEVNAFNNAITKIEALPLIESFNYGGGRFENSDNGVYFIGTDDDGNDKKPLFICSRLDVIGLTSGTHGDNWGRMVRFTDPKGLAKQIAIPATLWQGDGLDLRKMLADMGLSISSNGVARKLMMDYLACHNTSTHYESVNKLGWHNGDYMLPTGAISRDIQTNLVYQGGISPPSYSQDGTLSEWRDNVARYAGGNSRLLFTISVAFAAPMMHLAGFNTSTGFHIRGTSTDGKTTAILSALSVYGKPSELLKTWRNTANALEGTATAFNDGLLCLDELKQITPKDLETTTYMIGNGQAKGRANIYGQTKKVSTWRLLYLSTGELGLSDMLATVGSKTYAGQELRFIDLPSDAGKGFGLFDTVHNLDGATLSNTIRANAENNHGAAGIEWLAYLVKNQDALNIRQAIKSFTDYALPKDATAQHGRACDYFGLVAVAGELATEQGLTGWNDMEAFEACKRLFLEWMEGFGHGNKETSNIIAHVKGFIEAHGASRFEQVEGEPNRTVSNRVGFYRTNGDGLEYLIMPESFKRDLCSGYDVKTVEKSLIEVGILKAGGDGRATQKPRIGALGGAPTRVYILSLPND